jgi:hypothetical protein
MTVKSALRQWGTVEVEALESAEITSRTVDSATLEVDREKYDWRPSCELCDNLPEEYCVSLNAMSLRGEGRRFHPNDPYSFVLNASLGGLAILTVRETLNGEQRNSYDLMRLIFQYGPLVREALVRTFTRAVDLLVLGGVEEELNCQDVLPESLGLDASGKGRRWSVGRLMTAGERRLKPGSFGPLPLPTSFGWV